MIRLVLTLVLRLFWLVLSQHAEHYPRPSKGGQPYPDGCFSAQRRAPPPGLKSAKQSLGKEEVKNEETTETFRRNPAGESPARQGWQPAGTECCVVWGGTPAAKRTQGAHSLALFFWKEPLDHWSHLLAGKFPEVKSLGQLVTGTSVFLVFLPRQPARHLGGGSSNEYVQINCLR